MPGPLFLPAVRARLGLVLLALIVFAITTVPYVLASSRAPLGTRFGGFLTWVEDQDMYFSFIRQGADGHWLFVNRLTELDHGPVFFNFEWLAVGWVLALCGGSTDIAYQIWRGVAVLAVVFGFWTLARIVLHNPLQRRVALFMCLFGGTLEWLVDVLNWLAPLAEELTGANFGGLEMGFYFISTHPFAQMLANPHFALPLGVLLFVFAAFLKGEQTDRWNWYAAAGGLAALEGVMRPYDMIALYTVIPVFVMLEMAIARKIEPRRLYRRLLPLLIVAPAFLYAVSVFNWHPIFRQWAIQGTGVFATVPMTLAHVGIAGVLVAIRLLRPKTFPLRSSGERLLLVWMLVVFFFVHANVLPMFRFMPYTPQLITILMPPAILLGVGAIDPSGWKLPARCPRLAVALLIGFVALDAAGTLSLLVRLTPDGSANDHEHYIPATEMAGYEWLGGKADESDVVLCMRQTGHRLAKYASVRVVSGHWSVTPASKLSEENAQTFYAGRLSAQEAAEYLKHTRVTWIYYGAHEQQFGFPNFKAIPGLTKHVVNRQVTIYSTRP